MVLSLSLSFQDENLTKGAWNTQKDATKNVYESLRKKKFTQDGGKHERECFECVVKAAFQPLTDVLQVALNSIIMGRLLIVMGSIFGQVGTNQCDKSKKPLKETGNFKFEHVNHEREVKSRRIST